MIRFGAGTLAVLLLSGIALPLSYGGSLETLKGELKQDSGKYVLCLPDAFTLESGGQSISSKRLQVEGWTVADVPKLDAKRGEQIKLTGYIYPGTPSHSEKLVISVNAVPGDKPLYQTVIIPEPTVAPTPIPSQLPEQPERTESALRPQRNSIVTSTPPVASPTPYQNTNTTPLLCDWDKAKQGGTATPVPTITPIVPVTLTPVLKPTATTATGEITKSGNEGQRDSSLIGSWENTTYVDGYAHIFQMYITLKADGTGTLAFYKIINGDFDESSMLGIKNWKLDGDCLAFQYEDGGSADRIVIVERHPSSFTVEFSGTRFNMTRKRD